MIWNVGRLFMFHPSWRLLLQSLDRESAEALLRRQDALQAEAARVVDELKLLELLGRVGAAEQHGSSVSGLMIWRDIDFTVIAPDVTGEVAFRVATVAHTPASRRYAIRTSWGRGASPDSPGTSDSSS